ncbi:MAG: putative DNA-binding domain-containing protein [Pseudomonadota bacterium]
MNIYQELKFDNIESLLENAYPVLSAVLAKQHWHELIQDYFAKHNASRPEFYHLPLEFLDFLKNERNNQTDPEYLYELAHYEWTELALDYAEVEIPQQGIDRHGDLLHGHVVISPLAWLLQYHYPVHRIGVDYQPTETPQKPTYLIVYRDRDENIGFTLVNELTALLLNLIQQNPAQTTYSILTDMIKQLKMTDAATIIDGAKATLKNLRQQDIILGTRKIRNS